MEVQRCPHCGTTVIPAANGECPACRRDVRDEPAPRHTDLAVEPSILSKDLSRYHRQRMLWSMAATLMQLAFFAVAALVLARPLDAWLSREAGIDLAWLRCLAITLLTLGSCSLILFPFAIRTEFALERRYGLSRQTSGKWLSCHLRSTLRMLFIGSAGWTVLQISIYSAGPFWWLLATFVVLLWTIGQAQIKPRVFGPSYHRVDPLEDNDVVQRLRSLSEESGLQVEGVYRIRASEATVRPNAYVYGTGNTRRVLVTDTLLDSFTPNEIEVVLAHEVGHIVHRHVPKKLAIGGVSLGIGFLLCDRALGWWLGQPGETWHSDAPAYMTPFCLLVLSLWSLATLPIIAGINRRFERQCDLYALARSKSAADYRTAMIKLAQFNGVPLDPHPLEVLFLHDHPPPAQRIAMAGPVRSSQCSLRPSG